MWDLRRPTPSLLTNLPEEGGAKEEDTQKRLQKAVKYATRAAEPLARKIEEGFEVVVSKVNKKRKVRGVSDPRNRSVPQTGLGLTTQTCDDNAVQTNNTSGYGLPAPGRTEVPQPRVVTATEVDNASLSSMLRQVVSQTCHTSEMDIEMATALPGPNAVKKGPTEA